MQRLFLFLGIAALLCPAVRVLAATSTIDTTNAYAYGENIGWLNFGTSQGNVGVGDTALNGYVWGENVGWISLNCINTSSCATVNYSITRSATSTLYGYAWGENVGWISFTCANTGTCGTVSYGITVSSSTGDFSGYAWGENVGWISFTCANTGTCGTVNYRVSYSTSSVAAATSSSDNSIPAVGGVGYWPGSDKTTDKNIENPPPPPEVSPPPSPPAHTSPKSKPVVLMGEESKGIFNYPVISAVQKAIVSRIEQIKNVFIRVSVRQIFLNIWNFLLHPAASTKQAQLPSVLHAFHYEPWSAVQALMNPLGLKKK